MLDTEKIPLRFIKNVAENMGWDGKGDIPDRYVNEIKQVDYRTFVRRFAAWHLGDPDWADIFIAVIDAAREAEKESKNENS